MRSRRAPAGQPLCRRDPVGSVTCAHLESLAARIVPEIAVGASTWRRGARCGRNAGILSAKPMKSVRATGVPASRVPDDLALVERRALRISWRSVARGAARLEEDEHRDQEQDATRRAS